MKKQIIIITGISSGIGFHLSQKLSRNPNYRIYGILRNREKYENNLKHYGYIQNENLKVVSMDIRDYNKAQELIKQISSQHNQIDILINNAGYGLYGPFEELKDDDFRNQFETNFFAPLQWIRMVLPDMRKQKQGKILNITSILGRMTIPTGSAYCSSKYALVALTEVIRYELAPFGIQVCSIEPGLIQTDFKKNMHFSRNLEDTTSPYYPLNRLIKENLLKYPKIVTKPEEAAKTIEKLLEKQKLPAHFQIGIDATFYSNLKTLLPESMLDFLIKEYTSKLFK